MRIAVPVAAASGVDLPISPHFSRCPFFALFDIDGEEISSAQVVANPFRTDHVPGTIPTFIHGMGVNVILAGGMGYRAVIAFEHLGIRPVTGATGAADRAVYAYLRGKLQNAEPCHESVHRCPVRHGEDYPGRGRCE